MCDMVRNDGVIWNVCDMVRNGGVIWNAIWRGMWCGLKCQRWYLMPQWQCVIHSTSHYYSFTSNHISSSTHLSSRPHHISQHIIHFNLGRLPGHTSHGVMRNRVMWNLVVWCGMFCNVRCGSCALFSAAVIWNKVRCRICTTLNVVMQYQTCCDAM